MGHVPPVPTVPKSMCVMLFCFLLFSCISTKTVKKFKGCFKEMFGQEKAPKGAAGSTLPKCQFFDQMAFLHDKSSNKPTESNVQSPEDSLDVVVMESPSSRCIDSPNANKNISIPP